MYDVDNNGTNKATNGRVNGSIGTLNGTLNGALDTAEIIAPLDNTTYRNNGNVNVTYNDTNVNIDNAAEYKAYVESLLASLDVVVGSDGTIDGSMDVRINVGIGDDDDECNTYMTLPLDHHLNSLKSICRKHCRNAKVF